MKDDVKRSVIIKNLRNWYIIDSVLFNDYSKKVIKEDTVFNEYVSLKSALLSNLFEYYDIIGYTPTENETPKNVNVLQESASKIALKCKAISSKLLNKTPIKENIKNLIVSESKKNPKLGQDKVSDFIIQEKFLQLSLDNALIGLPLMECKDIDETTRFKGKILEEAHKMMRDSLVRLAMTCKKIRSRHVS